MQYISIYKVTAQENNYITESSPYLYACFYNKWKF